jgi:hypothetical protein
MFRRLKSGRVRLAGIVPIALLAASIPLSLIGAARAGLIPSDLRIRWNPDRTLFAGRVTSPATACLPNRLVRVFKVKEGPDKRIGFDLTDSLGRWRVDRRGANGRFYARVARTAVGAYYGQGDTCAAARSKTIRVPLDDDDDD